MKASSYGIVGLSIAMLGCIDVPMFTPGQLEAGNRNAGSVGTNGGANDEIGGEFAGHSGVRTGGTSGSIGGLDQSSAGGQPTAGLVEPTAGETDQAGNLTEPSMSGGGAGMFGDREDSRAGAATSVGGQSADDSSLTIVPSVHSGTAPLGVFFEVSQAQMDGERDVPVDYIWSISNAERGRDTGALMSHVFEMPGRYEVSVTAVGEDGEQIQTSVFIEVTDPAVDFAGERTVCIALESDFENCPDGAIQTTVNETTTFGETLRRYLNQSRRILLRSGEEFSLADHMTLDGAAIDGPIHLGIFARAGVASDEAERPVIVASDGVFNWRGVQDLRLTDWSIDVTSDVEQVKAIEIARSSSGVLLQRLQFLGNRPALHTQAGTTLTRTIVTDVELANSTCLQIDVEKFALTDSSYSHDAPVFGDGCRGLIDVSVVGSFQAASNRLQSMLGRDVESLLRLRTPDFNCTHRTEIHHNRFTATYRTALGTNQQSYALLDMLPIAEVGREAGQNLCRDQVSLYGNLFGAILSDLDASPLAFAAIILENEGVNLDNNVFTFGALNQSAFTQAVLPFVRLRTAPGEARISGGHRLAHNTFYSRLTDNGEDPGITGIVLDDEEVLASSAVGNLFVGHQWRNAPFVIEPNAAVGRLQTRDNFATTEMILNDGETTLDARLDLGAFAIRNGALVMPVAREATVPRDAVGLCRGAMTYPGAFAANDEANPSNTCENRAIGNVPASAP